MDQLAERLAVNDQPERLLAVMNQLAEQLAVVASGRSAHPSVGVVAQVPLGS